MSPKRTPLQSLSEAIAAGDVAEARQLLVGHPELLCDEDFGKTWLHDAARYDNVEMVELFVAAGNQIDAVGHFAKTPLDNAASKGCLRVARWLIDHGADVNAGAGSLPSPLIHAIQGGSLEMARLLLERGADVHATYERYGEPTNALSFALMYGKEDMAQLFREHGAVMPGIPSSGEPASTHEEILQHVEKHLGKSEQNALIEIVPISDKASVAIHIIRPTRKHRQITLFTLGMSDLPMSVPEDGNELRYAELLIYLPPDWPLDNESLKDPNNFWPIEWLRRLAYFPHEHETWFEFGQTVSNEEPPEAFAPGTELSCFLLLSPDEFSQLTTSDGRLVNFYEVYPLYKEERDLVQKNGWEALVKLFDKHKIKQTVDMARKNVAKPSKGTRR